jgi:hypothetical protein
MVVLERKISQYSIDRVTSGSYSTASTYYYVLGSYARFTKKKWSCSFKKLTGS